MNRLFIGHRKKNIARASIIAFVIILGILPIMAHATNNTINITTIYNPVQFEGLNETQSLNAAPPDMGLAAGPSHIVEMVNLEVAIYSKPQGTLVMHSNFTSFFKLPSADFTSDPKVLFDNSTQRWFASILACPNSTCNSGSISIAVSNSTDPTKSWNVYSATPSSGFIDQPILGISDNVLVVSGNNYANTNANAAFNGVQLWAFKKSEMVSGASKIDNVTRGPDPTLFSVQPVQSLSSTTTQYMVTAVDAVQNTTGGPANKIELMSLTGTPPGTISIANTTFTVSTIKSPPLGAEPLGYTVETNDARIVSGIWENGKLWLDLNDACTPTGDTQARSCVRFDEINTSTSALVQDFDFGLKGSYEYYAALTMDSTNNLGFIYGFSNSTVYPSLGMSGQRTTDAIYSVAKPLILRNGTAVEDSNRYGDYFGAATDPSDPTVIWLAGEYHHQVNLPPRFQCPTDTGDCYWYTAIASISFSMPDFSLTAPSTLTCHSHGPNCDYMVTVAPIHGFAGTVSLTVTASPTGSTVTVSPTTILVASGSATVSITSQATGTVTITGTSGTLQHSASTALTVS